MSEQETVAKLQAALDEISDVALQCWKRSELDSQAVVYSEAGDAYLQGRADAYTAVYRRLFAILGLPEADYTVNYEPWPEED